MWKISRKQPTVLFFPAQCKNATEWLSPLSSNSVINEPLVCRTVSSTLRFARSLCNSASSFPNLSKSAPRRKPNLPGCVLFKGICLTLPYKISSMRIALDTEIVETTQYSKTRQFHFRLQNAMFENTLSQCSQCESGDKFDKEWFEQR